MKNPIYTAERECQDCYKCVRSCPVKAITVKSGSAVVSPELCIYCGNCYRVCPVGAKKIRNDLPRAKQLIRTKKRCAISLSPSFISEYGEKSQNVISFLRKQGAEIISETALGAEFLNKALCELSYKDPKKSWIATACPVTVEYINLYRENLKSYMTPLASPMLLHGQWLKAKEKKEGDMGVIFIGPCLAKKKEADRNSAIIDVALTFEELDLWINEEGGTGEDTSEYDLPHAGNAVLYPLDGGMIASMDNKNPMFEYYSISGIDRIQQTFENLIGKEDEITGAFFECLACPGGCINGPGRISKSSFFRKKRDLLSVQRQRPIFQEEGSSLKIEHNYKETREINTVNFSEKDIERALRELDKEDKSQQLNCGGCGYNSCREFAISYLEGKSEKEMCAGNMRKLAQKKVNALVKTVPFGVVIVDHHSQIVEANGKFLSFFSDIGEMDYEEINKKIKGLPISNFTPMDKRIKKVLSNNQSFVERIDFNGFVYKATFFIIERERLAGIFFQDVTQPTLHRKTIVDKAEHVIRKNLESVQQIASLLGENAAETEIILNSVIEALQPGGDNQS